MAISLKSKILTNKEIILLKKRFSYNKKEGNVFDIRYNRFLFSKTISGYIRVRFYQHSFYAHHLVWFLNKGYFPDMIDHINRNRSDNRIENLRESDHKKNQYNSRQPSSCLYKGITKNREGKYISGIFIENKRIHLGTFEDQISAAMAYDLAAMKFHKEFAYLNFPDLKEYLHNVAQK